MAENVDVILEIHVNDSDESFDVNNCNELNILFGETQFSRPVDNNIIPLESKLSSPSNSAALNDFEIDLLKDPEPSLPLHCNFTQDNPIEYERASSYDPNDLFDKVGAFDCADQSDNDKWDVPQFDTDEKTGPKVLDNLAAAVNAEYLSALLKMQLIQSQKYERPDNCSNLCAPRVNSEI
jgi:hypothetical protein